MSSEPQTPKLPWRDLPIRAVDYLTAHTTHFGERHQIDWLTYSPLQMLHYHRMALRDADAVTAAITESFPEAKRFVDVGCGSGAFAAQLRRSGHQVAACEHARGGRLIARSQGINALPFDLALDPPATLSGPFDLAYSFEVAEHCPPQQGERLVSFLCGLASTVVFTAAPPGQGGLAHINEQPQSYWIERFERVGSDHDAGASSQLAESFTAHGVDAFWFAANVMVFRRRQSTNSTRVIRQEMRRRFNDFNPAMPWV